MLEAAERDYSNANLGSKRTAMLDYASKLTTSPGSIRQGDIAKLREVDFTDTDILHIAEVAAYYAYVNRIASGLGVELEQ